jgi:hypothetical protein
MDEVFSENLHLAFCNFHFSMKFSIPFQNAELIRKDEFAMGMKTLFTVIPANPGSGPGQAPESSLFKTL